VYGVPCLSADDETLNDKDLPDIGGAKPHRNPKEKYPT